MDPGRAIFRFDFLGFDFGLDLGLVLGPFWARLGRPFGGPNRVKLDPKSILKRYFFKNVNFHADLRFPMFLALF